MSSQPVTMMKMTADQQSCSWQQTIVQLLPAGASGCDDDDDDGDDGSAAAGAAAGSASAASGSFRISG